MRRFFFFVLLVLSLCFSLESCFSSKKFHSQVKSAEYGNLSTTKNFKKIYVSLFQNERAEAGINARLREKILEEINTNKMFQLTPVVEEAEIELSGSIDYYDILYQYYDSIQDSTRYELVIGISLYIRIKPSSSTKEETSLNVPVQYHLPYSASYANEQEALYSAQERALKGMSRRIVLALSQKSKKN